MRNFLEKLLKKRGKKKMKCNGIFKFKSITKRDGGSFTNAKGDVINYKESYALQVDEEKDGRIFERVFKLPVDSPLVDSLKALEPYQDIEITFDIDIYGSRIVLSPVGINY